MTSPTTIEKLLRSYLCLYWLRPETAIWRTSDALAFHDLGCKLEEPALDLACGDGLNSYVLLGGGEPPLELDAFVDTTTAISRDDFVSGRVDIYDQAPSKSYGAPPPPVKVDVGLDYKEGLLHKASTLHLYRQTVRHDVNYPLPFASNSFSFIFSNALYSMANLRGIFAELRRVLRPGGQLVTLLTSEKFRSHAIYRLYEEHQWEWCRVLDRGRHCEVEHCYPEEIWRGYFDEAGLAIIHMRPCLSSRLYQIAEVGLRPLSPVLIKMANYLKPEDRTSIKQEWIDYCLEIIRPMFLSGWLTDPSTTQIYYMVMATKR